MQLKSRRTFVLCTLAVLVTAAVFAPFEWSAEQRTSTLSSTEQPFK